MLKLVQELLQEREASRAELQHFDDEKPDGVQTTVLLQDWIAPTPVPIRALKLTPSHTSGVLVARLRIEE